MTPQIRIYEQELENPRPSRELIRRLAALPVANIGDAVDRLGMMYSAIHPVWEGARIAGAALPVWTRAGDNAAIHAALKVAKPGDILVVNGEADESRALIGELLGARALAVGIAGFVLDGCARDAEDLGRMGVPVFARACTPAGPYKFGPGRVGCTTAVAGVPVSRGDVILGDSDGVIVIPLAEAEQVAAAAEAVSADEAQRRASIPAPYTEGVQA